MGLTEAEFEILCRLLLRLHDSSRDTSIKRVAKSLFTLLTKNRFSTSDDSVIQFTE